MQRGSEITETAKGRVEFARVGTGPVILQLHGGATGYDQALALSWDLHQAGFAVLTPSRPGYLRTPLATGASPEQAADAVASLLDVHGRADGNVPFAHAEFVARTVPKVELLAIEDRGHLIWVGPGASQARERVLAFLRRHAPPPANPAVQQNSCSPGSRSTWSPSGV